MLKKKKLDIKLRFFPFKTVILVWVISRGQTKIKNLWWVFVFLNNFIFLDENIFFINNIFLRRLGLRIFLLLLLYIYIKLTIGHLLNIENYCRWCARVTKDEGTAKTFPTLLRMTTSDCQETPYTQLWEGFWHCSCYYFIVIIF